MRRLARSIVISSKIRYIKIIKYINVDVYQALDVTYQRFLLTQFPQCAHRVLTAKAGGDSLQFRSQLEPKLRQIKDKKYKKMTDPFQECRL